MDSLMVALRTMAATGFQLLIVLLGCVAIIAGVLIRLNHVTTRTINRERITRP